MDTPHLMDLMHELFKQLLDLSSCSFESLVSLRHPDHICLLALGDHPRPRRFAFLIGDTVHLMSILSLGTLAASLTTLDPMNIYTGSQQQGASKQYAHLLSDLLVQKS